MPTVTVPAEVKPGPAVTVPAVSPQSRADKLAQCHATIADVAEATLTAAETKQLDHLCDVAASGNDAALLAAEREICVTIVKASGLPAAAAAVEEQTCIADSRRIAG